MNIFLKIDNPVIIGLFRKMTNEQIGKIIRAYLNNNPKDLTTEEEKQIYTEFMNYKELKKKSNREKVVKSWETRKANRETNNKLQAQFKKDKDEMIKLRTENETLKKSSKQYNPNWNNNQNYNNNWKKKEEEPPKQPPREPVKTAVGWDL